MSTPFDTQPLLSGYTDTPDEDPLSNGGRFTSLLPTVLKRGSPSGMILPENDGIWIGESLWNPDFWTDASICWIVNNVSFGGPISLKLRADSTGLATYYRGVFSGSQTWTIWKRVSGGAESSLVTTGSGPSVSTLDRVGFAVIGTTLTLWHQTRNAGPAVAPINTNWAQVVTATDSAITGPGYTTLYLSGSETEVYGAHGGPLFPVGGGDSTDSGPQNPTFNVSIRATTTRP